MLKYLLILSLLSLTISINKNSFSNIVIENADRKIDLHGKYPQMTTLMKIKNNGNSNVNQIYLAVREDWIAQLHLLKITQGQNITIINDFKAGKPKELAYMVVEDLEIKKNNQAVLFEVNLEVGLKPKETISLTVQENYYNIMSFLPKKIKLQEDQLVVFEDNVYILSPYLVEKQKTEFSLSGAPITKTEIQPVTQRGSQLIYGSFENIKAFSIQVIKIHFMNNTPFALFKSVKSIIEVSHWGNIAIQTFYKLKNEGAEFTGEYSRVDYNQYKPGAGKSALKALSAELPYHAWGVYYRDEIGNISTSNAKRNLKDKEVKLEITPRFSLFGGWKSNFEIGYNLPLHHYLFQSSEKPNEYILKQLFGFPFDGFLAEEYELKIVLPEGAVNIESELPFLLDKEHQTVSYSYLDTLGKPTLVLKKNLVSDYHHQLFSVKYTFNKQNILFKPALLFVGFFLLFMTFIIIKRLEFKSLKVKDEDKNL